MSPHDPHAHTYTLKHPCTLHPQAGAPPGRGDATHQPAIILRSLLTNRRRSSGGSSSSSSAPSTQQPLLPSTPAYYDSMGAAAATRTSAPDADKGDASLLALENGDAVPAAATGTPVEQQAPPPPPSGAAWWWSKLCCVHPLLVIVQFIFSGASES